MDGGLPLVKAKDWESNDDAVRMSQVQRQCW